MSLAGRPFLPLLETFGDAAMHAVFSEQAALRAWLEVERALAGAQADVGLLPRSAAEAIREDLAAADLAPGELAEGTRHVGYPILPLLQAIGRSARPEVRAYLHWGATTQDIMDTGLALQLREALARIDTLERDLGSVIALRAVEHRDTVMAGRTHGQQAVPTTFGAKAASWLDELTRHHRRLEELRPRLLVVQLFGAGGTGAALGEAGASVRRRLAERLGLGSVDVPWHTSRDSLAEACFVVAGASGLCVRIAREVIDLARTEIGELREAVTHGRGASSTMPQKSNPILSEAIVGLGTVAATQLPGAWAAMQPRHERAAGEWQVEWDVIPTLFANAAGALARTTEMLEGAAVEARRMRANLEAEGGLIMAEALMMALAPASGRARAHDLVYDLCLHARAQGRSLREVAEAELEPDLVKRLPPIASILDPLAYLGEVGAIVDGAVRAWESEVARS
ncbi:adenylosuccinate lyase [soil metagenome]